MRNGGVFPRSIVPLSTRATITAVTIPRAYIAASVSPRNPTTPPR